MNRLLSLFFIAFPLMSSAAHSQPPDSPPPRPEYALAIHGGAGRAPDGEQAVRARQATLEKALITGRDLLSRGGASLDVVEAVVRILEDSPDFNAGKGAVFNAAETHELDATIMAGLDRSTGAVGGVTMVRNPISLARKVMTDTPHVLLSGIGADQFARQYADDAMIEIVDNDYFSTEYQRQRLHRVQQQAQQQDADSIGTVGCVALDRHGNLAAATSTGGLTNKRFGRLGDSPIAGAGTFADNRTCAVSCTGIGEDFIRSAVAYDVSARMAYRGDPLDRAVDDILAGDRHPVRGGIIAVSHDGQIVMRFNTPAMARAAADASGRFEIAVTGR